MALRELIIRNFALIDALVIEFKDGFTVLTGETGAGKSIIIDVVNSILGERVSSELVRTGEETAVIQGLFENINEDVLKKLEGFSIEAKEGLIIKREIQKSGKTRCFVNNNLVTLNNLRAITENLVDVHGQHDHQSLLFPKNQLLLLDSFAELFFLRKKYKTGYSNLTELLNKKESLVMNEQDKLRKIDSLSFQIKEIENARLKAGEDNELEKLHTIMNNSEKLTNSVNEIHSLIYGNETQVSALGNLQESLKRLRNLLNMDNSLEKTAKSLESIILELKEVAEVIADYKDKINFDPKQMEEVEDRRDLILRLKRKYGNSISDILVYCDRLKQELKEITQNEEEIWGLEEEIKTCKKTLGDYALNLSNKRKSVARKFEEKVIKELNDLGMAKTRFKVEISQTESPEGLLEINGKKYEIYNDGIDKVRFLISPNVGEELKPLEKIASGGEMSRVMLALKVILGKSDNVSTLIFDEIDTGIGGNMGKVVGEKMAKVAKLHQVICITHLPQIASNADNHIYVEKKVRDNKTIITIEILEKEGRIKEVARMLGNKDGDIAIRHAKELLKKS